MILKKPANWRAFFVHSLSGVSMIDENDLYLFFRIFWNTHPARNTQTMKTLFSSILALAMGVTASVAQIPGMMSMPSAQPLEGTSLGANETIAYDGIALGNRVKLRGYVDFIYGYDDNGSNDNSAFSATADVDFLVDFSPVTGEVH